MWLRPLLLLLPSIAWAINYKCQNDQVLVVQSFGNDTIRMHCQKLDLCGYQRLRCDYDEHQPQCGGLMNFVAHVTQSSATSPVEHTCCNLFNPRPPHMVTTHVGNDCFIYELPDGSSIAKPKEDHSDDTPLTVLKSAAEIPEHIDHVSGYRLRLFHLKNKSPPTLLVKGIERRLDGYRVTICRPRCSSFQTAGQERAANAGQREGTAADGSEWKVISWSSWTSSSWTTWANSVGAQGERTRTRTGEIAPNGADRAAASVPSEPGAGTNNVNVDVDANGNNNNKFGGETRGGFDRPTVGGEHPGHINITIHTAGQGSGAGTGAGNGNGATPNINVSANASNVIHNHVPGAGNDGAGKENGNGDEEGTGKGKGKKNGEGNGDDDGDGTGTKKGTGKRGKGAKGEKGDPDTDLGGEEGPGKANREEKLGKKPGHLGGNSLEDGEDNLKSEGSGGKGGKNGSGKGNGKGKASGSDSENGEGNALENGPKGGKGGDGSSGKSKGDKNKNGAGGGGDSQGEGPDGNDGDLHASTGETDGTDAASGSKGPGTGKGKDGSGKDKTGAGAGTGKKGDKNGPDSGKEDSDLLNGGKPDGDGTGEGAQGGKGGKGGKIGAGAGGPEGKNGGKGDLHASTGDGTNAATGKGNGDNGPDGKGPDADNGSKSGKGGKDGAKGGDKDKKDGKNGAGGAGGKGVDENEIRAGPDGVDAGKGAGKEGDKKDGDNSGNGKEKDKDGKKKPVGGSGGPGDLNPDGEEVGATWSEGDESTGKNLEGKKDGNEGGSDKGDGKDKKDGSAPLKQERQPNGAAGTGAGESGAGGSAPAGEKSGEAGTGEGPKGKTEEEAAKERLEHGEKDGENGSEANFEESESDEDKKKAAAAAAAAAAGSGGAAGIRTPDNRNLVGETDGEDHTNNENALKETGGEVQREQEHPNPDPPVNTGTGDGEMHASAGDGANAGPSNVASDPGTGSAQQPQADAPPANAMLAAMKNMNCFPADALVTTAYGKKRMDEVQVGDFVLVPSAGNVLKYERVEMFYHREESTRAQFVVIMTKAGKRMSLTPLHLLPFGQCDNVMRAMNSSEGLTELLGGSSFAHRAKVGDCVLSMNTDGELVADRITKIGRQFSTGIYSPMTVEGSLLVDGVLASCFSQLESHSVHKAVFDFLMYFRNLFGYEGHVHHEEQNIPSFISYVHDLSHYVLPFAKY